MSVNQIRAITAVVVAFLPGLPGTAVGAAADPAQSPGKAREWPCRIVVRPPLLRDVEKSWRSSASFRRQCDALADKRAVAELRLGAETSSSSARTRITDADGVVVGRVTVPLSADTIEFIAHELEHILERAEGVDLPRESERTGSGVWRSLEGFETQRAIDKGRQVAREVGESSRAARAAR
jgi:hypothetical protein